MSILQALCEHNGLLYAAWKGEVGDDRLFYSSFNGTSWAPQQTIPGNSSVGPSLAEYSGGMFAAWKGEHSDERVFYARFANGAWAPQLQIPGIASSTGPALATMGNRLYAAWKGAGSDQAIWYASFNGTWSGQAVAPGFATSVGPSLAFYDNRVYMAWKGMNNDQAIWYASFDGTNWSGQATIPGVASSIGPSLAAFDGRLYAAWKGVPGDEGIYFSSFDGTHWSPQALIPGVGSSIGPALQMRPASNLIPTPIKPVPVKLPIGREAKISERIPITGTPIGGVPVNPVRFNPGNLYAMWKGMGDDQRLFYASFDGAKWSTQSTIPGNTGQDTPQNIGLRMQFQETNEWCWIAVGTSINHFYNPGSTAQQCQIMTTIGQNINNFAKNTSACPSATAVASVPGLAAILANPYTTAAENVLNNPALGIPVEYIKSGGVGDALKVHGNWASDAGSMTLDQIANEVNAGRPVCVDIQWTGGGQHVVAVAGVLDDQLLICDPALGESVQQFEDFPATYNGGATIVGFSLTKAGS